MISDVAFSVVAERIKNAADARCVVDDDLLLAAALLRLALHEERSLEERLQAAHHDRVLGGKADLPVRKDRGVKQCAVGLRTGAARPVHGNAAQFVFNFGGK